MSVSVFKMVAVAAAMTSVSMAAQAGTVASAQSQLSVVISDAAGNSWDLSRELTSMLAFNAALGTVTLTPPAAAQSDADGVWTPNASSTLSNGQTVTGLGWHSWQTVDGSLAGQGTPVNASNPWAVSLIVTHLTGQIDPSMDYGFYFKNNSASTQNYAVNYGESIDPIVNGPYQISASISGAMTNTDGATSIGSVPAGGLIQQVLLSTDNGLHNVNAGVDVGPGATQAGTSVYGPFEASNVGVAPAAGYNYWSFNTLFSLTGNKDVFVANGAAVITAVPEPEGYALALAALAAMGLAVRRRQV